MNHFKKLVTVKLVHLWDYAFLENFLCVWFEIYDLLEAAEQLYI